MLKITRYIPNFITSLNVVCGVLSIIFAFESRLDWAGYCILIAAIFDFLDGLSARALKAYSPMGKELDSLADMISFGVAPAVIAFHIMKTNLLIEQLKLDALNYEQMMLLSSILLIPVFSALRLAHFNVDDQQTESFIGLPTPSNAIIYASLPIMMFHNPFNKINFFFGHSYCLFFTILVCSFLLVSPLPMFSLKMKSLSFKKYKIQFIFFVSTLLLIGERIIQKTILLGRTYQQTGVGSWLNEIFHILISSLPLIIFLYILLCLIHYIYNKLLKK